MLLLTPQQGQHVGQSFNINDMDIWIVFAGPLRVEGKGIIYNGNANLMIIDYYPFLNGS